MVSYLVFLAFPALMAFAGANDLLTMRIPNKVSLLLLGTFMVAAPLAGFTWNEIGLHLAAGAVTLAAGIVLFALGGFGGGDAKLLGAAAVWIGFDHLVTYIAYVTIFGGALAVILLAYRWMPLVYVKAPEWAWTLHKRGGPIPYGIAIAAAALLIYPETTWLPTLTS